MVVYDICNLTKYYPGQSRPVNKDITLQICQGEVFGILGDNGAGKSTLVRQMVNLIAATSGTITLFGQDVRRNPVFVAMNVGYMPQESLAMNNLTVAEALFFTAHLRGLSRDDARQEREGLLTQWGLHPIRDKVSRQLSGGQKRLLRLAVTMAGAPSVLILDEPTNDLDPQHRKLVWELLRKINTELGTTIIFITHDALEAEKVIQRVGIMRAGELVAVGRPLDLKRAIDHKFRMELFFPPTIPPVLPVGLSHHQVEAGRWLVFLEKEQIPTILNWPGLSQLDDFRLSSATLEDLYLHYATQS